ncbi:MAG: hypothetical protein A2289_04975 [Deltaproteobacteria bacterium RIFOXYA12_FULL_58_15]|nr:MAG: hypothetical protein A2289_04975 [Deltaproteobacteria bacterium RIFOXYA12_FULL_58_15]
MTWQVLLVQDHNQLCEIALSGCQWRKRKFAWIHAADVEQAQKSLGEKAYHLAILCCNDVSKSLELSQFARARCPPSLRLVWITDAVVDTSSLDNHDIDFVLTPGAISDDLFSVVRSCMRSFENVLDLEEVTSALSVANHEVARQNAFKERVLEKLGDGETGFIAQVLGHGKEASDKSVPVSDNVVELKELIGDVADRIIELFRPHDFRARVKSSLEHKNVVVLLSDPKALRITEGTLGGTTKALRASSLKEEGAEILNRGDTDLLLLDWAFADLIGPAQCANPALLVVLLTEQSVFEEHGNSMLDLPGANAVVINRLLGTEGKPDASAIQELVVTAGKLISGDVFGLEKYLSWGVAVEEVTLTHTSERSGAIDSVLAFAERCRVRRTQCGKLATITDELLMNAMWDAPCDASGKPKYAHLSRKEPLQLKPDEAVVLRYASDGNQLAVSVTDHFGRLARETAVNYLQKCFAKGKNQISSDTGGAGLGLYMAYLAMSNFVINVAPGKKTEVIGFVDLRASTRDMSLRPRTFHYFCSRSIRRAHPRNPAKIQVVLRDSGGSVFEPKWVKNISRGGLFVQMSAPPPLGTEVTVALEIPLGQGEAHSIRCRGHVVWSSHGEELVEGMRGAGIQLADLADAQMRLISDFIDRLPSLEEC